LTVLVYVKAINFCKQTNKKKQSKIERKKERKGGRKEGLFVEENCPYMEKVPHEDWSSLIQ
jgi:hypothetical protein